MWGEHVRVNVWQVKGRVGRSNDVNDNDGKTLKERVQQVDGRISAWKGLQHSAEEVSVKVTIQV